MAISAKLVKELCEKTGAGMILFGCHHSTG